MDFLSQNILVTITSSKYKVLGDYLSDYNSPAFPPEVRKNNSKSTASTDMLKYSYNFLKYIDDNGKTNLNHIQTAYQNFPTILSNIQQQYDIKDCLNIPIKPGITFTIPISVINKTALLTQGIQIVSNNEPAFKAQALIDLEQDIHYKPIFKQDNDTIQFGDLKIQYPDLSVWVWCRGLGDNGSVYNDELQGQLFDITKFITSINTSQTKNGGNFTLNLVPINAIKNNETGAWELVYESVLDIDNNNYLSESTSHKIVSINGSNELKRNQFLFHNIISSNDLVFIRFETLGVEISSNSKYSKRNDYKTTNNFIIDKNNIANNIYDMIGLIDGNSLNSQYESNDIQISIRGRDLSKIFIDDGAIFYTAEQKEKSIIIGNLNGSKNQYTERLVNNNAFIYLSSKFNNSIEQVMEFVIQQLSTIKVVPNTLLSSYDNVLITDKNSQFKDNVFEDSKIKFNDFVNNHNKRGKNLREKEQQIIKLVHDFRYSQYNINDSSFYELDLLKSTQVYESIYNFVDYIISNTTSDNITIAKIEQKKLIGWRSVFNTAPTLIDITSIYEDEFPENFITNDPNTKFSLFDYCGDEYINRNINDVNETINSIKQILQLTYEVLQERQDLIKTDFTRLPQEDKDGIWKIINLVIDKKVAKRILIDSSLSSAQGSLLNFFKKVCMEPFVEMFMDTYGDKYYVIVRQPPTNKVGMLSYLTGNYQANDNLSPQDNNQIQAVIINIDDIDIISDNLSYNDSNIYSWYHFTAQSNFINKSNIYSTAFVPAIFFNEYAEIWGSKSLDVIHNYRNFEGSYSSNSNQDLSEQQKQGFLDMQYIVESNAYMPFTRKGSITINGGDRRIKVGNPIRLTGTDEIFWVDAVAHNYSISSSNIERTTTIQVSRGMKEAFIYGVKGSVLNEYFKNQGLKFTDEQIFSYFDIIDTRLNFSQNKIVETTKQVAVTKNKPISDSNNFTQNINFISTGNEAIDNELKSLNPKVQNIFSQFINKVQSLGWKVIIQSSHRTVNEEKQLIKKDKRNSKSGDPSKSKHVQGLAIDINIVAQKNINGFSVGDTLISGHGILNQEKYWYYKWLQTGIPAIAKSMGIFWGGNFIGYHDNIHFEVSGSKNKFETPSTIIEYEDIPDVSKEILDETAVFSNFKVNKEVFNFFIRKQQEGYYTKTNSNFNFNLLPKEDNISISNFQNNNIT